MEVAASGAGRAFTGEYLVDQTCAVRFVDRTDDPVEVRIVEQVGPRQLFVVGNGHSVHEEVVRQRHAATDAWLPAGEVRLLDSIERIHGVTRGVKRTGVEKGRRVVELDGDDRIVGRVVDEQFEGAIRGLRARAHRRCATSSCGGTSRACDAAHAPDVGNVGRSSHSTDAGGASFATFPCLLGNAGAVRRKHERLPEIVGAAGHASGSAVTGHQRGNLIRRSTHATFGHLRFAAAGIGNVCGLSALACGFGTWIDGVGAVVGANADAGAWRIVGGATAGVHGVGPAGAVGTALAGAVEDAAAVGVVFAGRDLRQIERAFAGQNQKSPDDAEKYFLFHALSFSFLSEWSQFRLRCLKVKQKKISQFCDFVNPIRHFP
jgi:hypothetical protein